MRLIVLASLALALMASSMPINTDNLTKNLDSHFPPTVRTNQLAGLSSSGTSSGAVSAEYQELGATVSGIVSVSGATNADAVWRWWWSGFWNQHGISCWYCSTAHPTLVVHPAQGISVTSPTLPGAVPGASAAGSGFTSGSGTYLQSAANNGASGAGTGAVGGAVSGAVGPVADSWSSKYRTTTW
ncbi:hypothetical protein BU15DRAFT_63848 [Melanogaster broomeanus]|nr:hypothetical protein BU15DRAFT_63848 [Melanogaster broomeanus]